MKKSISKCIAIQADKAKIYKIWTDIESWHLWTKSITEITFVGNCKFETGGKARIKQPKLEPAVWTITEINENEGFTWVTKVLGVTITAIHRIETQGSYTLAKSELLYEGLLAGLLYNFSYNFTNQYLSMEAEGLKIKSESI